MTPLSRLWRLLTGRRALPRELPADLEALHERAVADGVAGPMPPGMTVKGGEA